MGNRRMTGAYVVEPGSTETEEEYRARTGAPSSESLAGTVGVSSRSGGQDFLPSLEELQYQATMLGDPATVSSQLATQEGDSVSRSAQQDALEKLKAVYDGGGYDSEDRKRLSARHGSEDSWARGQADSVLGDLRARGQDTASNALLARQMAGDDAIGRGVARDRSEAAMGQQRALEALAGYGAEAGEIRGQDWREAGDRYSAADAAADFNADATNSQRQLNATFQNSANQFNSRAAERLFGMQSQVGANTIGEIDRGAARETQTELDETAATTAPSRAIVTGTGALVGGALGGPAGAAAGAELGTATSSAAYGLGAGGQAVAQQRMTPGRDLRTRQVAGTPPRAAPAPTTAFRAADPAAVAHESDYSRELGLPAAPAPIGDGRKQRR